MKAHSSASYHGLQKAALEQELLNSVIFVQALYDISGWVPGS